MNENAVMLQIGPLGITEAVILSWAVIATLWLLLALAAHRLQIEPSGFQVVLEGIYGFMDDAVRHMIPEKSAPDVLAFVGALWVYILSANLVGLIPGLSSPTANLSVTSALALIVFFAVHWFGIREVGWKAYLRHYVTPTPFLLPFEIVSEISRTVALALRLFGNIMSLEMALLIVVLLAGLLIPVPILMLHIVEGIVQAYIFGMLALVYIASGLEAHQSAIRAKTSEEKSP
jgi:F-type H+-transporting ATPase subunit a